MTFSSVEQAAGYLGGIIDGEGYVCKSPKNRHIAIGNTDVCIMRRCIEACELLGITYRTLSRDGSKHKGLAAGKIEYRLHIFGKLNFQVILDRVTLCDRKQEALQIAVNGFVRDMPQPPVRNKVKELI